VGKSEPLATPVPLKLKHADTTMELDEFDRQPCPISPDFGASWQQPPAERERPSAAAIESAMFAQAISGLWGAEAESSPPARPPRGYDAAVSSEADQQPVLMGRYM